jgi:hypothetical protein
MALHSCPSSLLVACLSPTTVVLSTSAVERRDGGQAWSRSGRQKAPEGVPLVGRERRMSGVNSKDLLTLLHEVTKPRVLFPWVGNTNIPWTPQQLESEHRVNPEAWPGADSRSKPHHVCDMGSAPWGEDHVASDRVRQPNYQILV